MIEFTQAVGSSSYAGATGGQGPPVLLLHGFPQDHTCWHGVAPALSREHDAQDRAAGRTIACPVLVHWGAGEDAMAEGPLPIWRRWAGDVRGAPLPGGHFVPEEAADELVASLRAFLA